ncbi:MAG: hypothetical protein WAK75_10880 [Methanoregula sp.]
MAKDTDVSFGPSLRVPGRRGSGVAVPESIGRNPGPDKHLSRIQRN